MNVPEVSLWKLKAVHPTVPQAIIIFLLILECISYQTIPTFSTSFKVLSPVEQKAATPACPTTLEVLARRPVAAASLGFTVYPFK